MGDAEQSGGAGAEGPAAPEELARLQQALLQHEQRTQEAVKAATSALEQRLRRVEERLSALELNSSGRSSRSSSDQNLSQDEALISAAKHGKPVEVRRLLDAGANCSARDSEGLTPLHWASATAHEFIVSQLLEKGAEVHARDNYSGTPLHLAAAYDNTGKCVSLLIGSGADVHLTDHAGNTPLHNCAHRGLEATAKILLDAGASKTARNKDGKTPSDVARDDNLRRILSNSLNSPSTQNKTPAQPKDIGREFLRAAKFGKMPDLLKLMDAGVDVNISDEEGMTALHWAAAIAHYFIALHLLKMGAKVNAKDSFASTALHLAASYDDTGKCVALLIDSGGDVHLADKAGNTPLHLAALRGMEVPVQLLMAAGASPKVQNKKGKTPYELTTEDAIRKILSTSTKARKGK